MKRRRRGLSAKNLFLSLKVKVALWRPFFLGGAGKAAAAAVVVTYSSVTGVVRHQVKMFDE